MTDDSFAAAVARTGVLACPWCGRLPAFEQLFGHVVLSCDFARCAVRPDVSRKTVAACAKAWNKRAPA
jgi:hypothetical protein